MNKNTLATLLGVSVFAFTFGIIIFRFAQIRDRMIFPYLAEKTFIIPSENRETFDNSDGTKNTVYAYRNASLANTQAAIVFPSELMDVKRLETTVAELSKTHALVVVPIYRGFLPVSSSWPSEQSLNQDAEAVRTWVEQGGFQTASLVGQRLGAALAVHLSTVIAVANLDLYDPWLSTSEVFERAPLLALLKLVSWPDFNVEAIIPQTKALNVTFHVTQNRVSAATVLQKKLPSSVVSKIAVE